MNDEDISQFVKALSDFLQHAEVEEFYYDGRTVAQLYAEKNASELGVSTEYYLMEFA
jgi:hypothetical protein